MFAYLKDRIFGQVQNIYSQQDHFLYYQWLNLVRLLDCDHWEGVLW